MKVEPSPVRALDGDVPAHHLGEAAADDEAEAGAAVLAGGGGVGLGEGLEELAELLRRHADAGVGHPEDHDVAVTLAVLLAPDLQADGAASP